MPAWRLTIEANGHTFYVRHRGDYYELAIEVGGYPTFAQLSEARSLVRQMARRILDTANREDLLLDDDTRDFVWTCNPMKILEVVTVILVAVSEDTYRKLAREYRQYDSDAHRAFEASATTFKKPKPARKKGTSHAPR
jgi:hypothetical protein